MATTNTYKASIYFEGEVDVYVRAKSERQAVSIARRRVAKRKVGFKNIRVDFSDATEVYHAARE